MDSTPHVHAVKVERRFQLGDWGPLEVHYGDTTERIRGEWMLLRFGYPSARKVAKATRRAIKRHDEGSMVLAAKQRNLEAAQAAAAEVHSDWWMDSKERMDKLHGEALLMNAPQVDPGRYGRRIRDFRQARTYEDRVREHLSP